MSEVEAEFELGLEAEKFVNSNLFRYIDGSIDQDIEDTKAELLSLDPYEYKSLVELQNAVAGIQSKVKTSLNFRAYIQEILVIGKQAEHQLNQEDD